MEKTPFRLLAKVFLTVGGLLAAFLLIYMNATVEIPLQWRGIAMPTAWRSFSIRS